MKFVMLDYRFHSAEWLPELRHPLQYDRHAWEGRGVAATRHGRIGRAVSKQFANELSGPGQLLDAATHYIIMPDYAGSSLTIDGGYLA